ncbi:MAG: GNAT family N-acetyltransferase [Anaerolineae bacterium]
MTLDEMRGAVELQRTYWGNDLESVVPAHMLFSLATGGGHVLAAFDREQMVGVLIGFLGTNIEEPDRPAMANLQIISKRMIVLPEYRGHGVGYKLKKRQRELAMRQGVRLIVWTFDPLMAANAHLNIRKLGAISTRYLADYYGTDERSGLSRLGSSDRLLVEWWVTNRRVEERLNGTRNDIALQHYLEANTPVYNATGVNAQGIPIPAEEIVQPSSSLVLVEIPTNYEVLMRENVELARIWRAHIREALTMLIKVGYVVTDFVREEYEGRDRAFYLLSLGDKAFERVDFSPN